MNDKGANMAARYITDQPFNEQAVGLLIETSRTQAQYLEYIIEPALERDAEDRATPLDEALFMWTVAIAAVGKPPE